MTPRERLLAAITREPVDRFPFATYNCHPFSWGAHYGAAGYGEVLQKIALTSVTCLCKVQVGSSSRSSTTRSEVRSENGTIYATQIWNTPAGPLTRMTRKPENQPSFCVKPFITDAEDVGKFLSVPYTPVVWDVSKTISQASEIGEKGVPYIAYGDPYYYISSLFDNEEFAIQTITEFEFIQGLVDYRFEYTRKDLISLLDALAPYNLPFLFYTAGPELATPPLVSPDIFERLIVPYHTKLVNLIHEYGYPVCLHCHGRIAEIFPHVLACGFDAIEPLEPPAQGNISLEDLTKAADAKIGLMGYVQDQDFYLLSENQIREHVRRIADHVGESSGYICCPTCTPFQHPPSRKYVTNYLAFLDEAENVNL